MQQRPLLRPVITLLLLASATVGMLAQTPSVVGTKPSIPKLSSPDVYYSFFNYLQGLITTLQTGVSANPQNGPQLNQQLAAQLQIDVRELPIVISTVQTLTQNYMTLVANRKAGVYRLPEGAPIPTATQLAAIFDYQRVHLTLNATISLWQQLSTGSWSGLQAYVEGTYQNNIYKAQ